MEYENLSNEQREALRQKEQLLSEGNGVGYTPIPHDIFRDLLPELKDKYDGRTARDCLTLYMYFHAYTGGKSQPETYLWAYPTLDKIVEDTGIKRNRVNKLTDILVSEGLLITKKIPWYGHTKKMYLPLYVRQSTVKDTE